MYYVEFSDVYDDDVVLFYSYSILYYTTAHMLQSTLFSSNRDQPITKKEVYNTRAYAVSGQD